MAFTLHVASDVLQEKVNVEIPFTAKPGLDALRVSCEDVFTDEMRLLIARGGGGSTTTAMTDPRQAGLFTIGRMQICDDDAAQWVDLVSASQIHPFDQLYAFPLDLAHICQTRRELPPPRPAALPASAGGSVAPPMASSGSSPKFRGGAIVPDSAVAAAAAEARPHSQQRLDYGVAAAAASAIGVRQPQHQQQHYVPTAGAPTTISASTSVHPMEGRSATVSVAPINPNLGSAVSVSSVGASVGAGVVNHIVASASESDRLQRAYPFFDAKGEGHITATNFAATLQRFGILFSATVANEMFGSVLSANNSNGNNHHGYAPNTNGRNDLWSLADFQRWANTYPVVFGSLFHRIVVAQQEEQLLATLRQREESAAAAAGRAESLRRQLAEAEAQAAADRSAAQQITEEVRYLRHRRAEEEAEEQPVLDKEVSVEHQRRLLLREEKAFEAMASRKGLLAGGGGGGPQSRRESLSVSAVGIAGGAAGAGSRNGSQQNDHYRQQNYHQQQPYPHAQQGPAGMNTSQPFASASGAGGNSSIGTSHAAQHFGGGGGGSAFRDGSYGRPPRGGDDATPASSQQQPLYHQLAAGSRLASQHQTPIAARPHANPNANANSHAHLFPSSYANDGGISGGGAAAPQHHFQQQQQQQQHATREGFMGYDGHPHQQQHSSGVEDYGDDGAAPLLGKEYSPPSASSARHAMQQSRANATAISNARAAIAAGRK